MRDINQNRSGNTSCASPDDANGASSPNDVDLSETEVYLAEVVVGDSDRDQATPESESQRAGTVDGESGVAVNDPSGLLFQAEVVTSSLSSGDAASRRAQAPAVRVDGDAESPGTTNALLALQHVTVPSQLREEAAGQPLSGEYITTMPASGAGVLSTDTDRQVNDWGTSPEHVPAAKGGATDARSTQSAMRWYVWPFWLLGRVWDFVSLIALLAVVAGMPIVQLASLGYLLRAAGNLAQRRPWRESLPGLRLAGRIGTFFLWVGVSWLPVWLINDLSYSAQLLDPGSAMADRWRLAASLVTGLWLVHVGWAAMRGGRWWHFLWPQPKRFLCEVWRPGTWDRASRDLQQLVQRLHPLHLWWLGARGAAGALLWLLVPVAMMIVGLRALELDAAALIGAIGALGLTWVVMYLPFLQIQMAADNRFRSMFQVRRVRQRFRFAPLAHAFSLLWMCVASLPLYLLRIEATPAELLWAPALVFVIFMLPTKIWLGAAMGYAESRQVAGRGIRNGWMRWPARLIVLVSVLFYVGTLYIAQLIVGEGVWVMYFQHAFLVPAPLIAS